MGWTIIHLTCWHELAIAQTSQNERSWYKTGGFRMETKKCLFIYAYLLMFSALVDCQTIPYREGNANAFVDQLLKYFHGEPGVISKLEPIKIPDMDMGTLKGWNVAARGLGTLHRSGNCTIEAQEHELKAIANVGLTPTISMNYKAKASFFWVHGYLEGRLSNLALKIVLTDKEGTGHVESVKVVQYGNLKITKITGLSVILNWLLKIIAGKMANNAKPYIVNALENVLPDELNKILEDTHLPLYF